MPGARPSFDPELEEALVEINAVLPSTLTADMIPQMREAVLGVSVAPDAADGFEISNHTFASHDGVELEVSVVRGAGSAGPGPGIYHLHGGGMVMGNRWTGIDFLLPAVAAHHAVLVSVDYRLAPEWPDPTPIEDCYAGLVWTAAHAAELGIDPTRLMVAGGSAGGGLAAGCALLARDRGGPDLCAQMLLYPMLDDRNETISSHQIDDVGWWSRGSNLMGWDAVLGARRGADDVSIYAAPARATDLSDVPPAYIDCGSCEVFRDEDVAYASALWASGGQAELHVWPGGFHGFDTLAPHSRLAIQAVAAQRDWLARTLTRRD